MPEPVDKVPDPWEPYRDGRIWRFTPEEWEALPTWRPMAGIAGELVGSRQIVWCVGGYNYTRFFDDRDIIEHPHDWPDVLAGRV